MRAHLGNALFWAALVFVLFCLAGFVWDMVRLILEWSGFFQINPSAWYSMSRKQQDAWVRRRVWWAKVLHRPNGS